jgi:hypothetical protein
MRLRHLLHLSHILLAFLTAEFLQHLQSSITKLAFSTALYELSNHVDVGLAGAAAALIHHLLHYQTPQHIGSNQVLMLLLIVVRNSELPLRATPRSDTLFGDGLEADQDWPVFVNLRFGSKADIGFSLFETVNNVRFGS